MVVAFRVNGLELMVRKVGADGQREHARNIGATPTGWTGRGRGTPAVLRAFPASVPTGQVSFVVGNRGWRTHEMVVLPLAPGQAAGQRTPGTDGKVDEAGSLGEASASCAAGSGDGIKPGSVGWVTLALPAGRYELVCNLRNHYANGMHQAFVVTGH